MMAEHQTAFVIGVLADLSGVPSTPLPRLRDRRFVTVTRESFTQFLAYKKPRLTPTVRWSDAPGVVRRLELTFADLDDFRCEAVLRKLQESDTIDTNSAQTLAQGIVSEESFQALHGAWAGLKYLVDSVTENPNFRVKVLDVSKRDLLRDIQRAPEFDQSAFFRLVFAQELGTFGGDALGCVLGDYYLTSSHEDAELAGEAAKVVATACAPFLCGVQPELADLSVWEPASAPLPTHSDDKLSTRTWWDHKHEWPEGWALFLLTPEMRPKAEAPLVDGHRLPGAKAPRPGGPWFNPVYFVGAIMGNAFCSSTAPEIAERLFPDWSKASDSSATKGRCTPDSSATEHPLASRGGLEALDAEFKRNFPEEASNRLQECGLNLLLTSQLQRRDILRTLKPVAALDTALPRLNLAQALLGCAIVNRLRQYLRPKMRSTHLRELRYAAEGWLEALCFDGLTGQRVLPLDQFSVTLDGPGIRIEVPLPKV